jgi:hypothetical protein
MPTPPGKAIVTVLHEVDEGWHTFTSEQVPGLFLTGRDEDLEQLYESVPGVIADLAKADFGRDVVVLQERTFSYYVQSLAPASVPPVSHYSIDPQAA